MNWMEVALLILGVCAFVASFVIPEKKKTDLGIGADEIKKLVDSEMNGVKDRVLGVVDETVEYAMEKAERAAERISNEKIMAINEYSDTVLADVNKAHQEVMFLYDMLNDKHENLKETAMKVDLQAKEAQAVADAAAASLAASEETQAKIERTIEAKVEEKLEEKNEKTEFVPFVQSYDFSKTAPKIDRTSMKEIRDEVDILLEANTMPSDAEDNSMAENNNDKILRLYKMGMTSVDIAKELGLGVGEVKLVIKLFKGVI